MARAVGPGTARRTVGIVDAMPTHGGRSLTPAWTDAIAGFLTWMRAAGRAAGTVRVRESYLTRLAAWAGDRGPWELGGDDLAAWMAANRWRPESRKSARTALVGFYAWAEESGRIDVSPARRLPAVRVPTAPPRPAPDVALARALVAAGPGLWRTAVQLAALMGLRRGEIARVHGDDVLPGVGLIVHGKGGKDRIVPVHPELDESLGQLRGWLLPGRFGDHMTVDAVGRNLSRLLGPGWAAHSLRHRFATKAYAASGHDVMTLRDVLGHASVATTQRYVATDRAAAQSLVSAVA